jgi:hypothetical protein
MPELSAELVAATGRKVEPALLSRWLIRNGYRFKKKPAGERTSSARHLEQATGVNKSGLYVTFAFSGP